MRARPCCMIQAKRSAIEELISDGALDFRRFCVKALRFGLKALPRKQLTPKSEQCGKSENLKILKMSKVRKCSKIEHDKLGMGNGKSTNRFVWFLLMCEHRWSVVLSERWYSEDNRYPNDATPIYRVRARRCCMIQAKRSADEERISAGALDARRLYVKALRFELKHHTWKQITLKSEQCWNYAYIRSSKVHHSIKCLYV